MINKDKCDNCGNVRTHPDDPTNIYCRVGRFMSFDDLARKEGQFADCQHWKPHPESNTEGG